MQRRAQQTQHGRLVALLCTATLAGVYLCASGLLRLDEVFTQSSSPSPPPAQAAPASPPFESSSASDARSSENNQQYDRLVVVLIDALRADMVLGSDAMYGEQGVHSERRDELSTHMPYARSLVESGQALGYTAHASVPTVTMPRLKALVTGKAPAFIDILKNFNSAALSEPNLVALLAANGRRLVFYGDDTWLKLFPTAFVRTDGTSGFFTRDTVEVDANVTRHLRDELDPAMQSAKSRDWDVLVLHYLGLDHVGHLRGPRSPLMVDKLHEMDAVVERVHAAVKEQDALRRTQNPRARPSLVLLCSDHGMSEVGNHGGATVEESSALLLFLRGDGRAMKTRAYAQRRLQVDLVPTLASVLGLRIPPFSTGLLLDDVVRASAEHARSSDALYVVSLYRNFEQLRQLAGIKFGAAALAAFDAQLAATLTRLTQHMRIQQQPEQQRDEPLGDDAPTATTVAMAHDVRALRDACSELQQRLAQSDGSEYNARAVIMGLCCLFASAIAAVRALRLLTRTELLREPLAAVLLLGSVLQVASLTSSSSIENEHATAFYLLTTALCACGLKLATLATQSQSQLRGTASSHHAWRGSVVLLVLALGCTRVLRSRNQVINFGRLNGVRVDSQLAGNAFANDDSLSILSTAPLFGNAVPPEAWVALICGLVGSKALTLLTSSASAVATARRPAERLGLALASVTFTFGMLCALLCGRMVRLESNGVRVSADADAHTHPLLAATLTLAVRYSADDYARAVYAAVVLLLLLAVLLSVTRVARLIVAEMALWLLVTLLQRESNVPTLAVLCLQLACLQWLLTRVPQLVGSVSSNSSGVSLALLGLWLAQSAFFALGNSHLVTTIDISQSFHGLSGYTQWLVGLLTFVSVFSGPLVVFASLLQLIHHASSLAAAAAVSSASSIPPARESIENVASHSQDEAPESPAAVETWSPAQARAAAVGADAWLALFVYQTLRFAVYTIVVYFMRFHLFIWSVFAPKMLYEVAQTGVVLVVVLAIALLSVKPSSRPKRL